MQWHVCFLAITCLLTRVYSYIPSRTIGFRRLRLLRATDPIDPLENSKSKDLKGKDRSAERRKKGFDTTSPASATTSRKVRNLSHVSIGQSIEGSAEPVSASMSELGSIEEREAAVEAYLLQLESGRAKGLSLEILIEFSKYMEKYVPVVGLFMFTVYAAVLLGVVFIRQTDPTFDITWYLWIGPALFISPYVAFFVWDFDLVAVTQLDDRLLRYIRMIRRTALERVAKDALEVRKALETSVVSSTTLKDVALFRLLARIDPETLTNEVLLLKSSLRRGQLKEKYELQKQMNTAVSIRDDGSLTNT